MNAPPAHLPVPKGYIIKRQIASNKDKIIYIIENADKRLFLWKIFQKTYKHPLYESLMALGHKNMPRILDTVLLDDCFYIVEEYIHGHTIRELLDTEGTFGEAKVRDIMAQLCDVLEYLHNRPVPIIHRDITPANIMLTPDGTVKLLDFDIAREYKETAAQDTEVIGTKPFAPPEQYGFFQTDRRTDLYALGILLSVMLTHHHDPRHITNPHLRKTAQRCTAFAPAKRYATARQVKKKLLASRGTLYVRYAACAAAVLLLFLTPFLLQRGLRQGTEPPDESVYTPEAPFGRLTGHQHAARITHDGMTTMALTLNDVYNQPIEINPYDIYWIQENTDDNGLTWRRSRYGNFGNALTGEPHPADYTARITAQWVHNPQVQFTFTVRVAQDSPFLKIHPPTEQIPWGTPGRFTFPITTRNIPDGWHYAYATIGYRLPDGCYVSLTPDGFTPGGDGIWFNGRIELHNGAGELVLYCDGTSQVANYVHLGFFIHVPAAGQVMDTFEIRS